MLKPCLSVGETLKTNLNLQLFQAIAILLCVGHSEQAHVLILTMEAITHHVSRTLTSPLPKHAKWEASV